jgi:1-acyl-sn-glycerol-3-phosphate acyltransferase
MSPPTEPTLDIARAGDGRPSHERRRGGSSCGRHLACWLACVVLHALHGVLVVLLWFPSLPAAGRQARIAWWSAKTLRVLGLRLQVQGGFRPGAKLLVANHVSWIDIMAIHAVCAEARFVSKADVQGWPLLNRLVAGGETLYLERARPRDALRVVHQMAEALRAGDTVAVFPEGPGTIALAEAQAGSGAFLQRA